MVPCHSYCSSCFRNTELLGTFPNDNGSEKSRLFRKVGSQIFKNRNGSCHYSYCSSSGSKNVWMSGTFPKQYIGMRTFKDIYKI